jgi:hypothetical protein
MEQQALMVSLKFEVLGSNPMLFHEIIEISPVFSG